MSSPVWLTSLGNGEHPLVSGGDQLSHHIWAMGNSRVLEKNKVGHDVKAKIPKWEPRRSLFVAVKLALRTVKMALLQRRAWAPIQFESTVEKSSARNRATQPSFCGDMVKGDAVIRLRFQQRGLCRGAPRRGCRQQKAIRSDTATVQASWGKQIIIS